MKLALVGWLSNHPTNDVRLVRHGSGMHPSRICDTPRPPIRSISWDGTTPGRIEADITAHPGGNLPVGNDECQGQAFIGTPSERVRGMIVAWISVGSSTRPQWAHSVCCETPVPHTEWV